MMKMTKKNMIDVPEKVCTKCNILKSYNDFYKARKSVCSICKKCRAIDHKQWHKDNRERISKQQKQWRENNKEKVSAHQKQWRKDNKEEISKREKQYRENNKERRKQYREDNKEKISMRHRQWRTNNKEEINKRLRNKRQNDIQFKLALTLRTRMNMALKRNWKVGSAVRDLGCSIEELKERLEEQFQSSMTWDNYGKYGWHIDHIKPLSNFDLTDRKQFLEACNYTNLQPMWAEENLSKGNRL